MRQRLIRFIRLLGLIFLFLLTLDSCATPQPQLINLTIPSVKIVTEYPSQMKIDTSYILKVSLISKDGKPFISSILKERTTKVVTDPTPVGTPSATFLNAFGPGYEPFVTATLNASSFVVEPNIQGAQSLRQTKIEWYWDITPNDPGTQNIIINIWVQWFPTQSGQKLLSPTPAYSIGIPQITIDVVDPNNPDNTNYTWTYMGIILTAMLPNLLAGLLLGLITWLSLHFLEPIMKKLMVKHNNNVKIAANSEKAKPARGGKSRNKRKQR